MKKPVVVVNLKTYKSGKDVLKLCREIERVDKSIIVGANPIDVYRISNETKLNVFCQHVDFVEPGKNTGFLTVEGVKGAGAKGVFLNHSEHRLEWKVLVKTVERCKKIGLKILVFTKDLVESRKVEKLGVDYICWEPAELVGGDISVSSAKPGEIEKVCKGLNQDVLVGAGVKTHEDLEIAMKLGASGVALASGVTKARNPRRVLKELIGNA